MWQALLGNLKDINSQWAKMTPGKKAGAMGIAFVLIVCVLALGVWVGEKSYAPLYTNLQPEESIQLVKILQEESIPYLVTKDGTTISIPPELVQPTLMKLAVRGTTDGHKPGLEIFDKESFGTSSYVQRINYVRALQGELIRTINTLKSVKKSTVHISMPPKSSFFEQSEDPKASVVIELNPGKTLTKEEVRGVQNLIAASVEGLRPERVTVVDSTGLSMSRTGDGVSALSTTMLERQKQIETELERKVEDLVTRIVGQGNVVARVTAELDFDPLREQETVVDPEQVAMTSQDKSENNVESTRPVAGGEAAGAQAALPGPASEPSQARQAIAKNTDRSQFEVSRKYRTKEKALGTIKRLSVAVLVNSAIAAPTSAGEGKEGEKPQAVSGISEEKKKVIEKIVREAAGIQADRDTVSVEAADFATEDMEKADQFHAQQERRRLIFSLIRYGTVGLFILLFFIVVVRPFIRWLTGLSATKVEAVLPKTVEELEELQDQVTNALPGLASLPLLEETVDLEKAEGELLKEKVISLVEAAPHKAAQIISEWVASADPQNQGKKRK